MKQNCSYDTFYDPQPIGFLNCNRHSDALPIVVTCTGSIYTEHRFSTSNPKGRLDYYLMYIAEGKLRYQFGEKARVLGSGSVVLFPPKCGYHYQNVSEGKVYYFWSHFTGSDVERVLKGYGMGDLPFVGTVEDDRGNTASLFEGLWRTLIQKKIYFEQSAGLKMEAILLQLGRGLQPQRSNEPSLSKAVLHMHTHYRERLTLEQLAALENLSVSRFCDVFRQTYGTSPIRYLMGTRIKTACELLKTTDLPVWEVGEAVGYRDVSLFARQFKSLLGMTPGVYRNSDLAELAE